MIRPATTALIVAGGSGQRFGRPGGKQLLEIAGRPVLAWTVEAMASVPGIGEIVVVCPAERIDEYRRVVSSAAGANPIAFAASGATRQESVASGLLAVDPFAETVAIHDGARPLVRRADVERAIRALSADEEAHGAVVGHPSTDTLKRVEGAVIDHTPRREHYWVVQTPQVFRLAFLREAYAAATAAGFVGTDDASVVERYGGRVLVVEGARDNIKVTVPEDALVAEALIAARRAEEGS